MWDSSGSANDNPYDDGGDATQDDNTNSPRGSGDDGGVSKEPKPEEKEKNWYEKGLFGKWREANQQRAFRDFVAKLPKEVTGQLAELGVLEQDFTGVVYVGLGASIFMGVGISNEGGCAYMFENGQIVDSKDYQSIAAGFYSDYGTNVYGILGVMPNAKESDLYGFAGVGTTNISLPALPVGVSFGVATPSDEITAYEFSFAIGPSSQLKGSVTTALSYTQEFNSQASSYYIPPINGLRK